jgi:SAM-dependent methyltransferase
MVPPQWMIYTGQGPYLEVGNIFFEYFKKYGNIHPDFSVLDIGSGLGRMAIPFVGFLSSKGAYTGIEIVKTGVQWCQKKISGKQGNFHFYHADIQNDLYNKKGCYRAESFKFPFKESSFDFIFLTSVFTHMHPEAIRHYLDSIYQLLKVDRKCLFSCSIINSESLSLIKNGKSYLNFTYDMGNYYSLSPNGSTDDVGLKESWLCQAIEDSKLTIDGPIHFGKWCGRTTGMDFQDIVVVTKK